MTIPAIAITSALSKGKTRYIFSDCLHPYLSNCSHEDSYVRFSRPRKSAFFKCLHSYLEGEWNQRVLCWTEARSHSVDTLQCYIIHSLRKIQNISLMILLKFNISMGL